MNWGGWGRKIFGNIWSTVSTIFPCFVGPCHQDRACLRVADGGYGLQILTVAGIYWTSSHWQPTRRVPPAWKLGERLRTFHRRKRHLDTKCYTEPHNWKNSLARTRQREIDKRFGIRNVSCRHTAGSLETEWRGLAKYKLDILAVQGVRAAEGGSQPADDYIFFYRNGNTNHHLGADLLVYK